jgi:plasmid stability protein
MGVVMKAAQAKLTGKRVDGVGNTALGRQAREAAAAFEIPVFKTEIAQLIALAEAVAAGQTIMQYASASSACEAFQQLTKEVIACLKNPAYVDVTRKREEFVKAGDSGTETQTTVYTATRNAVSTEVKKATFNLNAALHQRLKVAAAVHGREMVEPVTEALEEHLGRLENARKTLRGSRAGTVSTLAPKYRLIL